MKAYTLNENGSIENFKLSEVESPKINDDEVLIKVKAISINPVDASVRQNKSALHGILKPGKDEHTFILGWDVSGIIEDVGSNITEFKKNDEVLE